MKSLVLLTLAGLVSAFSLVAGETGSLAEALEPFRPILGKTFRGEFKNSKPDKPTVDVARWERALNGQAVRVIHSVNDGSYGGESLIQWDKEKKQLIYHYFTTAGFYTKGTMTHAEGKFTGHEVVTGNANGITEVKSTTEWRADGTLWSKAEYLKKGEWSGGREVLYKEDAQAAVIFK